MWQDSNETPSLCISGIREHCTAAVMDREDALSTFVTLTGANGQVAGHLLDSFGGDLDSAINFYLESGGVGYGGPPVPASPPDYVEEPDVIEEEPGPVAARSRSRPLPAAARPRSSPIEVRAAVIRRRCR